MEQEDTKIPETQTEELAYRMHVGKGIFIGDSAATSRMTTDMTGLYNLQKYQELS